MMKDQMQSALAALIDSAFDFLDRAVEEIGRSPKHSLIQFATAIELLLKARLMAEHWTLIAETASSASRAGFLDGSIKTVSQSEAIKRLDKLCDDPVPQEAAKQFERLAAHRNRVIHFYHSSIASGADPKLIQAVVAEQCASWLHLERILRSWGGHFARYEKTIKRIDAKMRLNRQYLEVVFQRLSGEIENATKKGVIFRVCSSCGFEAAEVSAETDILAYHKCLVCQLGEIVVETGCPSECGGAVFLISQDQSSRHCPTCGDRVTTAELERLLSTDTDDPLLADVRNCAYCGTPGSVVPHQETFVCTECLEYGQVQHCDWCNEMQLGGRDLEWSWQTGCEFCPGHSQWGRDD